MEIEQNVWGFTPDGEAVVIYRMINSLGASVSVTNIGAAVVSINVPDRSGVLADVVLGYSNFKAYEGDEFAMGKVKGRYSGIISSARFNIGDETIVLNRNFPPHHRNGGSKGLEHAVWQSRVEVNRIVFSHISPDNEQGYPGELSLEVIYDWDDECNLEITYLAKSDKATVVNLSSAIFFNLSGDMGRLCLDEHIRINSQSLIETNSMGVPSGRICECVASEYERNSSVTVGTLRPKLKNCAELSEIYWALPKDIKGPAIRLSDSTSGRYVDMFTTQRAVKIDFGDSLFVTSGTKDNATYKPNCGIGIEATGYPDAPNISAFPPQSLDESEIYEHHTIYSFGVSDHNIDKQ